MRFPMPLFPCAFELPNDWLVEAGWINDDGHMIFQPTGAAYPSTPNARLISKLVEPLGRDCGYGKNFHGFDRGRMLKIPSLSGATSSRPRMQSNCRTTGTFVGANIAIEFVTAYIAISRLSQAGYSLIPLHL
jgi:hypothetical protein